MLLPASMISIQTVSIVISGILSALARFIGVHKGRMLEKWAKTVNSSMFLALANGT